MPSLAIHYAIAKKYLESHKEENEEEFYQGTIAPDIRAWNDTDTGKLHYGKNSNNPDLNRYYQEVGLNSSYNRGYFLHLLTDYLFYHRILDEYSIEIEEDYQRLNKKIVEKYDLDLPSDIRERIYFEDGEITEIDEQKVYHFIDSVART